MTVLGKITPILRIFDEAKAKEFYVDFLGFKIDWEHRFADDLPLYMQVSKDDCILHLSGHFGDCCPGSAVRIETTGLEAYHQQLLTSATNTPDQELKGSPGTEWRCASPTRSATG